MTRLLLDQRHLSAAQVFGLLQAEYGKDAPSIRTVQRAARELRPPDPSTQWTLVRADPDEVALAAPVLSFIVSDSDGRINRFTNAEVAWIARLRRMANDLPPLTTYRLAVLYRAREDRGQLTDDLDAFVLFASWRDGPLFEVGPDGLPQVRIGTHRRRYDDAVKAGWVTRPPFTPFVLAEESMQSSRQGLEAALKAIYAYEAEHGEEQR